MVKSWEERFRFTCAVKRYMIAVLAADEHGVDEYVQSVRYEGEGSNNKGKPARKPKSQTVPMETIDDEFRKAKMDRMKSMLERYS